MAEEMKLQLAKEVYATLCASLDNRGWHYSRDDEHLIVDFGVRGDDIPMKFIFAVDIDRQLVRVMSPLPFSFSEEKRIDGAIATCAATFGLADGSFDYDISNGSVIFRMTATFRESKLSDSLFQYLIDCASFTVDEYNDKFLAIDKGILGITDFIANA